MEALAQVRDGVAVNASVIAYDLTLTAEAAGRVPCGAALRHIAATSCRRQSRHEDPMAIHSGRAPQGISEDADSEQTRAGAAGSGHRSRRSRGRDARQRQVHAAETRLLYENATTGITVTIVIASVLAYAHWDLGPRVGISAWLAYTLLVAIARFVIVQRYWRAAPTDAENGRWNAAFVAGAGLAAAGWGVGAILLYPSARPMNEILVVFAIGGLMLGAASLLAARPEAYLTFLLPTGFLTSLRLASLGDEDHLMMGFLGAVFTVATVVTTWRFHLAIESSFRLRFDNDDLIESLQSAKNDAEALNRELELRVRDRTAKLMEEDQRKDEFLATLAHELRNPLAPIRFALEALKVDTPRTSAARARDVIERQVRQLVRLVDDLLDVSRITANKIQLRRESLDLAHLMATAVESITPLAAAAGHTLDVQPPSAPVRVHGDGARLVQVFANVLNNAVKFTPRGGHMWFTADQQSNEAVVRIRDTGLGIASDVLPRVFDMFHQAEPALDRSTGGLGIGLTLARRLVQLHDGQIDVRSPGTGQGTEVEIRLPITAVPAATAMTAEQPAAVASRTLRVLIVEDNLDAAEMLELAVSHLGHITRVAHDGAAAITAAGQFAPDLIFLDIGLPVMNGYAVARTLRGMSELHHVHIAALTGWGQEEDRRKARDAGCDSHFTKPLAPATLEDLLAAIAQGKMDGRDDLSAPRTRLADSSRAF
jgi:signal transduction histidine kinase/ActR/RegA family two-component response regulator